MLLRIKKPFYIRIKSYFIREPERRQTSSGRMIDGGGFSHGEDVAPETAIGRDIADYAAESRQPIASIYIEIQISERLCS